MNNLYLIKIQNSPTIHTNLIVLVTIWRYNLCIIYWLDDIFDVRDGK